jgi:hypothetical protein
VVVVNTPPVVTDVAIAPAAPTAVDALECGWTFTDADGDLDDSTVAWFLNGVLVGTGTTLPPGAYGPHDVARCEVTPDDGEGALAVQAAEVVVGYQGGWPMNAAGAGVADPGWSEAGGAMGSLMYQLRTVDQYGEEVDLYDFAGLGVPVVLCVSAMWSSVDAGMAELAAGRPSMLDFYPTIAGLPAAVAAGDFYFVTVLVQDATGGAPDAADAVTWATDHPNDLVPVLVDTSGTDILEFFDIAFVPTIVHLDDEMVIVFYDRDNPYIPALEALLP